MDDKLDLKTLDIKDDKIEQLKKAFPEVVTEGKVDFEKLRLSLGEEIEVGKERYEMKWPGKANLSKIIQEPSIGTLKPVKDASVDFGTTENLFIEGDSLEVLKLLQKSYYGKIKMIYIDPPYNTGKDFIYPDNYTESLDTYLRYTGQKGEEGLKLTTNAETEGRYHSKWMNMIYPRLFLARNLLKEDGVIFISIDDHEADNLKKICNEIFGEENFIEQVIWKNKYGSGAGTKGFASVHEYILCYSKTQISNIEAPLNKEQINEYKSRDEKYSIRGGFITQPLGTTTRDNRPNLQYSIIHNGVTIEPEKQWIWAEDRFKDAYKNNEIVINETNGKYSVRFKQYLKDEKGVIRRSKPVSILNGPFNQEGTAELRELLGDNIFPFPKPMNLIRYFASFTLNNNDSKSDIILDFMAGSATTAHAVLDLNKEDGGNRKFIIVQLQEPITEDSEANKAGYKNIAEIGKERIRRVIKKIKDEISGKLEFEDKKLDLGFKVFRLDESNFKLWDKKSDAPLQQQLELTVDNINDKSSDEEILYEIILKSGFELSVLVEKVEIQGKAVYSVDNKSLLICLENDLSQDLMKEISEMEPARVVFLDRGFGNNDELKTNTVELMKAKSVEFKTV